MECCNSYTFGGKRLKMCASVRICCSHRGAVHLAASRRAVKLPMVTPADESAEAGFVRIESTNTHFSFCLLL